MAKYDGVVRIFPVQAVQLCHFLPLLNLSSYNTVISCHQLPLDLAQYFADMKALIAVLPGYVKVYNIIPKIFAIIEHDMVQLPRKYTNTAIGSKAASAKDKLISVSVVIPVHNAGPYISRCIDSLKAQTLEELEFIFVDDCSEDESMDMVREWAAVDRRVRILRNERNLGEGGSRNRGMEAARGVYINTIDPDDWVAPDYYELLYAKAVESSADIVKGSRTTIDEETVEELTPRSELNARITQGMADGMPLYSMLHYEHQTLLFKRVLLDKETKYGTSANAADTVFLLRLCHAPRSISIEDRAVYYYLKRTDSATGEYSLKRSRNELLSLKEMIDFFFQKGDLGGFAYRYLAKRYHSYASRFVHAYEGGHMSLKEKEKFISDFKNQFLRLPDCSKYYKFNPKIFGLIELDIILSNGLNRDITIGKEQAADWITYIMALEGERTAAESKRLVNMLVSYLKARREDGASLRTIAGELLQMSAALKNQKQKKLFWSIVKSALRKSYS